MTQNQSTRALFRRACRWAGSSLLWVVASTAIAQTSTTIFQQTFAGGLGAFTATGTVTTGNAGAVMAGSTLKADGSITSKALSTQGYTGIVVSFDRVTANMEGGMLAFDEGVFEYAINGGSFTRLEATRVTTPGRASFVLPATANNSNVTLRFRVSADVADETYTVNNVVVAGSLAGTGGTATPPPLGQFSTFESGHVRPMVLSADGASLYVVNTPDARVEVFDVTGTTPLLRQSIPVGLEPVAVALAPNGRLWVVNHLSDSISIVDVSVAPARVVNTLLVGDEPRDIVFAGPGNRWAFITAAHRGQNAKFDPKLTTSGVGRADVWVFDANSQGTALGGTPATVLNMFGDTLRGLARNADGSRVYTAVFNSGNRTTVVRGHKQLVLDKSGPTAAADGTVSPATSLIVQKNANGDWVDAGDAKSGAAPKAWNQNVRLDLPDYDVFTIDTTTATPMVINRVSGVGTTLFNLAVNPASGKLYVSNQEARNVVRFEGPGKNSSTVNGNFVQSRITVIDGASVLTRHLNKHITSYGKPLGTAAENAAAVSTPLEMAVTPDGGTLYLVSMGTNKLARYATSQLETDSFTPSAAQQLVMSGGLPTGVVLDAPRGRAFVTTRQDNGVSVVNTAMFREVAHVTMANPEPADVVKGRRFMYDSAYTSSRGDSACASCHIFGDMDQLAWDLGNPDDVPAKNNNAYNRFVFSFLRTTKSFHPMKGPMTTQSFRGMAGNGPLHWRGDRQGVSTGVTLEERSFKDFSVAFPGLLGRETALNDEEMTSFARYALKLVYPPSPVANLDTSLTAIQKAGQEFYMNKTADTLTTCNGCHALDPSKGQYGTDGTMAFEGFAIAENFKIPQLRNMDQKVGSFTENEAAKPATGAQIRGFGYAFDGALGTVDQFLSAAVFVTVNATERKQLEEFVLAFPSDLQPVVGQQVTVTPTNGSQGDVSARLNLLVQRAMVTSPRPECELVAKGVLGAEARGWVLSRTSGTFVPDRRGESGVSMSTLLSTARTANAPLTFTCAPPGNGNRLGIDRNGDGRLDRD